MTEAARIAVEAAPTTRFGRSSDTHCPVDFGWFGGRIPPAGVDLSHRLVLRVPRSAPHDEVAPHGDLARQHVPLAAATPKRRDARDAQPSRSDDIESIGASVISEFTWKQLLDTDACTMCGRCTSVCPANTTGKPLDPREIVLKLGEVAARSADPQITPPITVDHEITVSATTC